MYLYSLYSYNVESRYAVIETLDLDGVAVNLEEVEVTEEHVFPEPDSAEGVQQPLVKVVGDPASVLYLPEHVTYARPVNTLWCVGWSIGR